MSLHDLVVVIVVLAIASWALGHLANFWPYRRLNGQAPDVSVQPGISTQNLIGFLIVLAVVVWLLRYLHVLTFY